MLRDKLSKLDKHFISAEEKNAIEKDDSIYNRYQIARKILGGEIYKEYGGSYLKIESNYNSNYRHGNLTIRQLSKFSPYQFNHFEQYGRRDRININKLL